MPLTLADIEQQLSPFTLPHGAKIAVGISGGADSLCLTLLLNEYAKKYQLELTAITINHAIRPHSRAEAEHVATLMQHYHINHIILDNPTPIALSDTKIEEKARAIRYDLLTTYCNNNQIPYLCMAHHRGDQVETFLSRLARGSGVEGLSSIKPHIMLNSIAILRPFLDMAKADIIATLQEKNQCWIEDEMNQNPQFERVKWRQFIPQLEKIGISPDSINTSINRLRRAQECIDFYTHQFIKNEVHLDNLGYITLNAPAFYALPTEIKIKVMAYAIKTVGQQGGFISLQSLERLVDKMPKSATLGSCAIVCKKQVIFVCKEAAKMPPSHYILANTPSVWDRFLITSPYNIWVGVEKPVDRLDNMPYIVEKSFPVIKIEKKLETFAKIAYKDYLKYGIKIVFLTNKG